MPRPPAKAQSIALRLTEDIKSGEYRPGTWLPSERELAQRHSAGRATVRHALRLMAEQHVIILVPDRGAKVLDPARPLDADQLLRDGHDITLTFSTGQGGRINATARDTDGHTVATGTGLTFLQAMTSLTPHPGTTPGRPVAEDSPKVS
ncbi:winged helix-turn-helix domain-containing protein [Nonomuraea sp. CA-141351]|uniref:winged helix-turn-helix domain-containing protein n=1 Tax=Nonomuraea sp. CA-141351 TaxID=3239996 RepID=UPI003D9046CF